MAVASGSRLFVAEVGRKIPTAVFCSKELGDHEMLYSCFKNLGHIVEISQLKMFHNDKYIATWELHVKTN